MAMVDRVATTVVMAKAAMMAMATEEGDTVDMVDQGVAMDKGAMDMAVTITAKIIVAMDNMEVVADMGAMVR